MGDKNKIRLKNRVGLGKVDKEEEGELNYGHGNSIRWF